MTNLTKSVTWIQVEGGVLKELLITFFSIITDFQRKGRNEVCYFNKARRTAFSDFPESSKINWFLNTFPQFSWLPELQITWPNCLLNISTRIAHMHFKSQHVQKSASSYKVKQNDVLEMTRFKKKSLEGIKSQWSSLRRSGIFSHESQIIIHRKVQGCSKSKARVEIQ